MYTVRMRCGKQLAHEAAVKADLVSTVPESATPAAMGYAQEVKFCVKPARRGLQVCIIRPHLYGARINLVSKASALGNAYNRAKLKSALGVPFTTLCEPTLIVRFVLIFDTFSNDILVWT